MSEPKYYVKLKLDAMYYTQDWSGYKSLNYITLWLDKTCELVPESDRDEFTKSELAEIMDDELYAPESMPGEIHIDGEVYESDYHPEWINPLIEIVPVEDGE